MIRQELNQNWTLSVLNDNVYHIGPDPIPVTIPGSVYSGLLENNRIPDPYWRDNELDALRLMDSDFLFRTCFAVSPKVLGCSRIVLRLNGVDTIADIVLNGVLLGHVENMHRTWEYDVTGMLQEAQQGDNVLEVRIASPTRYIAQANEKCFTGGTPDAMPGFPQLRKAHCMFGWDWGPRLPDAGIYRPVELLGIRGVRLSDDIRILQEHVVTGTDEHGHQVRQVKLTVQAGTDPAYYCLGENGAVIPCGADGGMELPEGAFILHTKDQTSAGRSRGLNEKGQGFPGRGAGALSGGLVRRNTPVTSEDIGSTVTARDVSGNLHCVPGTHIECEITKPKSASSGRSGGTSDKPDAPGKRYFASDGTIVITDPQLWWPNGYGPQPLYTVTVRLFDDETGRELDRVSKRIGLRTLTVDTSPYPEEARDPHLGPQAQQDAKEGRHFDIVVNGLPIFAMGADYIPEDNILQRVTPERTRRLLTDARDAHHNCIRVWGGGYYPDDFFYDLCDELGVVVWQDFMFACANYELSESFEENVAAEFVDVIRRLRHHASLGLWCGNNEMETQTLSGDWKPSRRQFYDYIKLYEYILPKIVRREDPQRFYWPSSPSSGGNYEDSNEENMGDAHYWGVWHGGDPFPDYRRHHFRFLSEFGFQSFPCEATVDSFTEPEDRNIFSEIMEMHQRNTAANGKIMNYLSATYRYPKDFASLLYCSQMLQMDAIRYGVEHFRRIRGTCMGTVVWQLNDIWPVASWSSIDYYGRWKALHYGEKRFFAPVSITCEEHGRLDQKPFVNTLPVPVEYSAALHVANETGEQVFGIVRWSLRLPDSTVVREESREVSIAPYSGVWLEKRDFTRDMAGIHAAGSACGDGAGAGRGQACSDAGSVRERAGNASGNQKGEDLRAADERDLHLWYEFIRDGQVISSGSALFAAPKHYHFVDPRLSLTVNERRITVHAAGYAKGVCIESADGNLRLSDNFFDMEKGERTVEITGDVPEGEFRVRSVYDI